MPKPTPIETVWIIPRSDLANWRSATSTLKHATRDKDAFAKRLAKAQEAREKEQAAFADEAIIRLNWLMTEFKADLSMLEWTKAGTPMLKVPVRRYPRHEIPLDMRVARKLFAPGDLEFGPPPEWADER